MNVYAEAQETPDDKIVGIHQPYICLPIATGMRVKANVKWT